MTRRPGGGKRKSGKGGQRAPKKPRTRKVLVTKGDRAAASRAAMKRAGIPIPKREGRKGKGKGGKKAGAGKKVASGGDKGKAVAKAKPDADAAPKA